MSEDSELKTYCVTWPSTYRGTEVATTARIVEASSFQAAADQFIGLCEEAKFTVYQLPTKELKRDFLARYRRVKEAVEVE